jgi:hypothetical protein
VTPTHRRGSEHGHAITVHVHGINLHTTGVILMVAGAIGLCISLVLVFRGRATADAYPDAV